MEHLWSGKGLNTLPSPPLPSAVISAFYDQRFIGSSSPSPPLYLASFLNQSINCTDVPEEKE